MQEDHAEDLGGVVLQPVLERGIRELHEARERCRVHRGGHVALADPRQETFQLRSRVDPLCQNKNKTECVVVGMVA